MARRLPLLVMALAAVVLGLAAGPAGAAVPNPPNDVEFPNQSGLKAIKAPAAWALGTGSGIKVAVVSSGIAGHPDLAGKTEGGFDATGDNDPTKDTDGRGTHLAGIVGAATNNTAGIAGTAPDARLLPFRAFASDSAIDADAYLQALSEAGAAAPVVLVDLPSGFPADKSPQLLQALKTMGGKGISVVVGVQSGISLAGLPVLPVAGTSGQAGAQGVVAPSTVLSTTATTPLPLGAPDYDYDEQSGSNRSAALAAGAVAILRGMGASGGQAADLLRATKAPDGTIDVAAAAAAYRKPPPASTTTTATTKPAGTPTTVKGTPPTAAAQPGGAPALGFEAAGDLVEPGEGEEAVVPPGAEEFFDEGGGDTGGTSTLLGGGEDDNRPLGMLAVGFGLLCGVGTGLSLTFRRLADAPL